LTGPRPRRVILKELLPEKRRPLLTFTLAASVVVACGEIAGLRDPGAIGDPDAATDGAASADDVLIEPTSLDLGAVACGTTSKAPSNIVIKNRGSTNPKYKVQVAEGSGFELQGALEGELGKDATVTIGVVAKPSVAGDVTAEVSVSAGAIVAPVALKAHGEGARIEIAPTTANVGQVRRENGGSLDVALTNSGNEPATITKIDSSLPDFSASWEGSPAPLAIEAGATKTIKVALAKGADSEVLKGMLTFGIDGAVCGAPPVLPIEGQRVNQDVTISPADFGNQLCTTTPTLQRDIVISNYTSSTLAYTANLKNGAASVFQIVSGASDTIAPGTTETPTTKAVKLSMKAPVPATVGAINEVVDVEVGGIAPPSGGPRTTAATANVRGVVLKVSQTNMTGFQEDEVRYVTFTNTGNEPWSFGSAFIREPGTTNAGAWVLQSFGGVNPGASVTPYVWFNPYYYGTYAGSWTFQTPNGVPFCNGTPKLRVQGTK
jgi:hypothetical protein